MPNTASAAKRVKQIKKRTSRNRYVKSRIKTTIKDFKKAMADENQDEAKEKLKNAVKLLDKAAHKGVIHRNKAARKKSQLTKHLNNFNQED